MNLESTVIGIWMTDIGEELRSVAGEERERRAAAVSATFRVSVMTGPRPAFTPLMAPVTNRRRRRARRKSSSLIRLRHWLHCLWQMDSIRVTWGHFRPLPSLPFSLLPLLLPPLPPQPHLPAPAPIARFGVNHNSSSRSIRYQTGSNSKLLIQFPRPVRNPAGSDPDSPAENQRESPAKTG